MTSKQESEITSGYWLCRDKETQWWRLVLVNNSKITAPWILGASEVRDFERQCRKPSGRDIRICLASEDWILMD